MCYVKYNTLVSIYRGTKRQIKIKEKEKMIMEQEEQINTERERLKEKEKKLMTEHEKLNIRQGQLQEEQENLIVRQEKKIISAIREQEEILVKNKYKFFGKGAKLKKKAKDEINRLNDILRLQE